LRVRLARLVILDLRVQLARHQQWLARPALLVLLERKARKEMQARPARRVFRAFRVSKVMPARPARPGQHRPWLVLLALLAALVQQGHLAPRVRQEPHQPQ
jgi:hypothetical protein